MGRAGAKRGIGDEGGKNLLPLSPIPVAAVKQAVLDKMHNNI